MEFLELPPLLIVTGVLDLQNKVLSHTNFKIFHTKNKQFNFDEVLPVPNNSANRGPPVFKFRSVN